MHLVVLERWSRGRSILHARDARAKILAVLSFLVVVATTPMTSVFPGASYGLFLLGAVLLSRIPVRAMLVRAAVILPFSAVFAAASLLAGDGPRAAALLQKSYLSALAVLLLAGTTPLPELLRGLESLGVPRFLLLVIQFLYRYLFVISEQAQHMRLAAACRGPSFRLLSLRGRWLTAAGGAVSVLFARSYGRAEGINRAMLARCFRGHISLLYSARFKWTDALFLLVAVLLAVVLRISFGGLG